MVKPDKVLEEYPRPQLKRPNWKSLNGLWKYAVTDTNSNVPADITKTILVPFPIESALSGVQKALTPDKALWYKRSFNYKTVGKGRRLLLNFGAVDQQAEVYINGQPVGRHRGGYQSFSCDITSALKTGQNEILVKVIDPTDAGYAPKGKQTLMPAGMYYTATSGIWQTVWLEELPEVSVRSLKMTPDLDHRTLHLSVLANIALPKGYTVKAKSLSSIPSFSPVQGADTAFDIHLTDLHCWSPEDPFLYDIRVSLLKNGRPIDSVDSYFGMRKIEVKKDDKGIDRIFLNNQPYFNAGVLDQGFWPDGLYTAPADEALAFDVKAIKAMGFNTIRKHIKVEPDRWYYHCDKLGMLVWQDMVNPPALSEEAQKQFETETAENITMLYNHPSIVVWVVFNEGWGAYDQGRITKWVKSLDPARLVNGHTGENYYQGSPKDTLLKWAASDMTDIHAYPDPQMPPSLPGKARVLGEFGGIGSMITGHQSNDLGGWGYITLSLDSLARTYQKMLHEVKTMQQAGLSGSIYTQPFDVESEQNGLITYDRRILKVPITTSLPEGLSLAPDETGIFNNLKQRFLDRNADSLALRQLAILSIKHGDTLFSQEAVKRYLSTISDPSLLDNLRLIGKLTNTMDDPGFSYLIKYSPLIKDNIKLASILEKMKEMIIVKELNPVLIKIQSLQQWDSIKALVSLRYGNFVEEVVERNELVILQAQKRWNDFASIAIPYLNRYGAYTDPLALNAFAYDAFLHINDPATLAHALKWAELALNKRPDPNIYDTFASLLYKTGRKEEALKVQSMAVKMGGDEKIFEQNYEKMKNGTLTWD